MTSHQTQLVSKSRFARLAGVTPQMVQKLIKKQLADAVVGPHIDANHKSALHYLEARGVELGYKRKEQAATDRGPTHADGQEAKEATAAKIIQEQGLDKYLKLLDANKKTEDIKGKQLLNEERQGRLISRAFMDQYIFGAMDTLHQRLLTDVPRTIARRMYALCRSDAPEEAAERVVSELISAQLKAAKENMDSAIAKFVKTRDAEAGGPRMGRP